MAGDGNDTARDIAIDALGNRVVVGSTTSADFPIVKALQPEMAETCARSACTDAFVMKLSPQGEIVFSTFFGGSSASGGSGADVAWGVSTDAENSIYVTGTTHSVDFPTTAGAVKSSMMREETRDAWVAKFDASGSLVYSTLLGGSRQDDLLTEGIDEGRAIDVDAQGRAVVAGYTSNVDFPMASAMQPMKGGGLDAFVTVLNEAGGKLESSTFLGGDKNDYARGINSFTDSTVAVTGTTSSTDFPIQGSGARAALRGPADQFLSVFNSSDSSLRISSLIGGRETEIAGQSIVPSGNLLWVVGSTNSSAQSFNAAELVDRSGAGLDSYAAAIDADTGDLKKLTTVGGPARDEGTDVTKVGRSIYLAGTSTSSRLPGGASSPQRSREDGFFVRLRGGKVKSSLLFGGGRSDDATESLSAVDSEGGVLVAVGSTRSLDFPTINSVSRGSGSNGFLTAFRFLRTECDLLGTWRADRVVDSDRPATLCGGRGRDILDGRGGNDWLRGGPGFDRCEGGGGRDRLEACERSND